MTATDKTQNDPGRKITAPFIIPLNTRESFRNEVESVAISLVSRLHQTGTVLGLGRSHGRSIGFTKRDDQYRVIVRIGLKKEHQSRPGFISGAEWNAQEFVRSLERR